MLMLMLLAILLVLVLMINWSGIALACRGLVLCRWNEFLPAISNSESLLDIRSKFCDALCCKMLVVFMESIIRITHVAVSYNVDVVCVSHKAPVYRS